ncbi:MAG: choice-of-anchor D domain-containing protein [Burkholderiales bacterium]
MSLIRVLFRRTTAGYPRAALLLAAMLALPQFAASAPQVVTASPDLLSLGTHKTGTTSPVRWITLTAPSATAVTFTNFKFIGPFRRGTGGTCATSLPAAATCTLPVQFLPTANGLATGTLDISHTAEGSFTSIKLIGSGRAAAMVAGGASHSLALRDDGSVWAWGRDDSGQLGDPMGTNRRLAPVPVLPAGSGVTAIAAGDHHNLALKADGSVWAWGANGFGQVGNGGTASQFTPVQVIPASGAIVAIAAGRQHSLAITATGSLYAWGDNSGGQLGDDRQMMRTTPTLVGTIANLVAIAAGWDFSLALHADGTVWGWGFNGEGQLGDGSFSMRATPVQALFSPGNPVDAVGAIATGGYHSLALRGNGALWGWGSYSYSQLSTGSTLGHTATPVQAKLDFFTPLLNVSEIASGSLHSFARTADGTLRGWGFSDFGDVGNGTFGYSPPGQSHPVAFVYYASTVLDPSSGVVAFDGGGNHGLAALADGSFRTWGRNQWGQVGDGTNTDRYLPVATNFSLPSLDISPATLSLSQIVGTTSAPQVVTLGNAGAATLTIASINSTTSELVRTGTTCPPLAPPETGWALAGGASCTFSFTFTPQQAGLRGGWIEIASNAPGSPALFLPTLTGLAPVAVTSYLDFGPIYVGTTSAMQPATITNNLAAPVNFASFTVTPPFANTGAGSCGASLAPGASCTVTVAFAPTQPGASAGSLAIASDGPNPVVSVALLGSGVNAFGVAGATAFPATVIGFPSGLQAFTLTNATGAALPAPVLATTGDFAIASHTCTASLAPGSACSASLSFTPTALGPRDGRLDIASEAPGSPQRIALSGVGIPAISLATQFVFPATEVGGGGLVRGVPVTNVTPAPVTITAIGWNGDFAADDTCVGVLGAGETCLVDVAFAPAATGLRTGLLLVEASGVGSTASLAGMGKRAAFSAGTDHSLLLRPDGSLAAWGGNDAGQVGDGSGVIKASPVLLGAPATGLVAIAAGARHSLAVKSDGTVLAWGDNSYRQLADAVVDNRLAPAPVEGIAQAIAVAGGRFHSIALRGDGTLWTWGNNASGQLGDGTTITRASPVQVMSSPGVPMTGVVAISAGEQQSYAVTSDGSLWGWGNNSFGQLGDGSFTARSQPVRAMLAPGTPATGVVSVSSGRFHALGLRADGTAIGYGNNTLYQLGNGANGSYNPVPSIVNTGPGVALQTVVALASGLGHNLALLADGSVHSWGQNTRGQLGIGALSSGTPWAQPVLGLPAAVEAIGAGDEHSLATTPSGIALAWGYNNAGQIGDGTAFNSRVSPTAVAFAPSVQFSPAALDFPVPVQVGQSAALQATISNAGNGPLSISSITAGGDFAVNGACVGVIASGGSCTLGVTFTPTASGMRGATVLVASNAAGSPHGLVVSGTGYVPVVQHLLGVIRTGAGSGTVASTAPASPVIDCGTQCEASFAEGTAVRLVATPQAGSVFAGWTGCTSIDAGDCLVTVSAPSSIGAAFEPAPPAVTATLTPASVNLGPMYFGSSPNFEVVTLANTGAVPVTILSAGYSGPDAGAFQLDTDCPPVLAVAASCTYTVYMNMYDFGAKSATLAVTTSADNSPHLATVAGDIPRAPYGLLVNRSGTGTGAVVSTPSGIDCPLGGTCESVFDAGTMITLTASPWPGSVFTGWSGAPSCSTEPSCTFLHAYPLVVTANFELLPTHLLSVAKSGTGSGTVTSSPAGISCGADCEETYVQGTSITLAAAPAAGSAFTGWNVASCGVAPECVVTVDSPLSVTAFFGPIPVPQAGFSTTTMQWAGIFGTVMDSRTVTITSLGTAPLDLGVVSVTGPQSGSFLAQGCSLSSMAPGANCLVTVFFQPASAGNHAATLAIPTNDPARPVLQVSLAGVANVQTYTVTVNHDGGGTVGASSGSMTCVGLACTGTFETGASLTLTAVPHAGSRFSAWTACPLPGADTCSMTVTGDITIGLAFAPAVASAPDFPDFNADGRPDIIWSNTASGATYIWRMSGTTLIADSFLATIDPSWRIQGVADFNGDGHPDVVWRNTANGNCYVWYLVNGVFQSDAFVFGLPPEWVIQGVADFNADGKPDFLMRNTVSGNAFAWFFNDNVAIGDQFLFSIDPSWKVEGVADLNADGQPDLLFRNMASGLAFAWNTQFATGTLSLTTSSPPIFGIDPVWEVVQVADWNADGKPDLLFRNASTGLVFVWYLDGVALGASDYVIQIDPSWEIVPRR